MATQTLPFAYTTGQTLTAKLFSVDDLDTVVATADSVTEGTNAKSIYFAAFVDIPAGDYIMIAYVAGTAAWTNDAGTVYRLLLATGTYQATLANVPSVEQISDRIERAAGPLDTVPKYGDSQQRDKTSATADRLVESVTKVVE